MHSVRPTSARLDLEWPQAEAVRRDAGGRARADVRLEPHATAVVGDELRRDGRGVAADLRVGPRVQSEVAGEEQLERPPRRLRSRELEGELGPRGVEVEPERFVEGDPALRDDGEVRSADRLADSSRG